MKLFDNPFSPFARKVRLVLDLKGLNYETVDGLDRANARALEAVNSRIEVPTLVDGDVTVVNSSDIVAYLEDSHPEPPVYPRDPAARVRARAWERCADTVIDPILADISYWSWAERPDAMPTGMREAAQRDLDQIYEALERDLEDQEFVCGDLSIADIALFPHLSAVRALGVAFSPERYPRVSAWVKRMRSIELCRADLERARTYLADIRARNLERRRIFWRGDRIEWVLARGYHDWFMQEIMEGRVIWPGLGIPGRRT
ncbi:MAG: glutathione S-transferase family protein [Geminicoccaceae bacterium]